MRVVARGNGSYVYAMFAACVVAKGNSNVYAMFTARVVARGNGSYVYAMFTVWLPGVMVVMCMRCSLCVWLPGVTVVMCMRCSLCVVARGNGSYVRFTACGCQG